MENSSNASCGSEVTPRTIILHFTFHSFVRLADIYKTFQSLFSRIHIDMEARIIFVSKKGYF